MVRNKLKVIVILIFLFTTKISFSNVINSSYNIDVEGVNFEKECLEIYEDVNRNISKEINLQKTLIIDNNQKYKIAMENGFLVPVIEGVELRVRTQRMRDNKIPEILIETDYILSYFIEEYWGIYPLFYENYNSLLQIDCKNISEYDFFKFFYIFKLYHRLKPVKFNYLYLLNKEEKYHAVLGELENPKRYLAFVDFVKGGEYFEIIIESENKIKFEQFLKIFLDNNKR